MTSFSRRLSLAPRALVFFGLGLGGAALASAATSNPETPVTPPKTHVMFVGAEIDVHHGDQFLRIEDVTGSRIVARSGDKPVELRMSSRLPLRVSEAIKVANKNVAISNLKTERTYTLDADPFRALVDASQLAAGATAVQDIANREMRAAESRLNYATAQAAAAGNPQDAAQWAAAVEGARSEAASAQAAQTASSFDVGHGMNSVGAGSSVMQYQAAREAYNAIRVSFEIQPEHDLPKPYVAVIAQIRDPGSKPGEARKWVYVKSLNEISAGEKKTVSIYEAGMPPGFEIEHCDVHVFNGTEEFATSLSRRRIEVTDDEAHQFQILGHISANKGRTLPPSLVARPASRDVWNALDAEQRARPVYARVSKTGKVVGAFRDAGLQQPLHDARIEALLQSLRFNPALEAGRPVEATVSVNLDDPK